MPQKQVSLADFIGDAPYQGLRELFFDFEFSLVSCVFWKNQAPWILETRSCADSFLLFPLRGELLLRCGRSLHSVPPGRFVMLPERTAHSINLKNGHPRLDQISLHCHIRDRWGRPLLSRFASPLGRLSSRADIARLKELAALMSRDPAIGKLAGESFLKELMAAQIRQGARLAPVPGGDPRIGLALEKMEGGLASPDFSIEKLALQIGLSAVRFRKLFRQSTGIGPKEFLSRLRFQQAARFLRHSNQAVKRIAHDCGFASDHYFHLAFRREFGCTPSSFRRKNSAEV